jgi:signal transduction histidine kinase
MKQNIFSVTFSALSYFNPTANRYRYRLEGLDRQWIEVSSDRRVATYTTLPAGSYTFRVQGATSRGAWSEPGAKLDITILPPWWGSWWFGTLCAVTIVGILWTLYLFRLRQITRLYNIRLDERVNERIRIARELHDSLLQGFQGLMFRLQAVLDLLPERAGEAIQALEVALERGDKAIAEGRDTVADLRHSAIHNTDLAQALSALSEDLALQNSNGAGPSVRVLVEGKQRVLDPLLRDEIYRIGREALRNAFRHSQARTIEAEIAYGNSQFVLRVRDDGNGIGSEVLTRGARSGHWGLPGMRERASSFGGGLEVWSERGAGTEVQLKIPASIAYGKSDARRSFWFSRKKAGETEAQS